MKESRKESRAINEDDLLYEVPEGAAAIPPGESKATAAISAGATNNQEISEEEMRRDQELLERAKIRSLKEAAVNELMMPVRQDTALTRLPGAPRPVIIDGNNVAYEHGNHQR